MKPTPAVALVILSAGVLGGGAVTAQPGRPVRIGALTEAWGPPKGIVGCRDGLQELG